MMFLGVTVIVMGVLILGIYLLQKSLSRTRKAEGAKLEKVRVDDEAAFTLAAVKGVIAQLKSEQKVAEEKLVAAERRAEENARKFELLAREFEHGLIIFDAQGFISFSNSRVRKVLAVDTWSRRRYGEIFQDFPALAQLIGECFETGTETRKGSVDFQGSDGRTRRVEVSVLLTRDSVGALEIVACMFRELPAPDA